MQDRKIATYFLRKPPGYASLPACRRGKRRIDRNQTSPKSPRLRRVIIACNPRIQPQPRRDAERERKKREGESGGGGDEGTRVDKVISLLISMSPALPLSPSPALPLSVHLTPSLCVSARLRLYAGATPSV